MSDYNTDFHEMMHHSEINENNKFLDVHEVNLGNNMESFNIQPEVRHDVPGVEPALVFGNPYEAAEHLDNYQGDNKLNARGDCGLVSTSNVLTLCGIKSDEESITEYAVENGLCNYSRFLPPESRGGTTDSQICEILRTHGVEASAFPARSAQGNCEAVAEYVEEGRGVEIGINAGYGWQDANYIDDGSANHQITVTGTVRDTHSGELKGFIVCDSGLNGKGGSRFMSIETLRDAYEDVQGASAIVTDDSLRKV